MRGPQGVCRMCPWIAGLTRGLLEALRRWAAVGSFHCFEDVNVLTFLVAINQCHDEFVQKRPHYLTRSATLGGFIIDWSFEQSSTRSIFPKPHYQPHPSRVDSLITTVTTRSRTNPQPNSSTGISCNCVEIRTRLSSPTCATDFQHNGRSCLRVLRSQFSGKIWQP
ncbi:hypothetical protein PSTT_05213, partial [Puccinia striiformis]